MKLNAKFNLTLQVLDKRINYNQYLPPRACCENTHSIRFANQFANHRTPNNSIGLLIERTPDKSMLVFDDACNHLTRAPKHMRGARGY